MNIPVIKFNAQDQPTFVSELRKRVNNYFEENNISRYANWNMKFKTIYMVGLYVIPYMLMMTGVVGSNAGILLMWALMGFGMSGIGMCIMHDANHGSYSKHAWVNQLLGALISIVGGFRENWKIQHNVLHHSFTNIEGHDEDIELSVMRMSPTQERKKMHAYQDFYAPVLYGIMTVYWSLSKDIGQVIRYSKKDLLRAQGLTLRRAIIQVGISKILYFTALVALPIILLDVAWYIPIIGYFIMHFICGTILAFIFQCAHVLEETDFFEPDSTYTMENNWAIHQMRTTANFANRARIFSWFVGGLNYQIEHHLFPNVCHVHYHKIAKIVKKTAQEFNVPYHEHKTFYGAVRSHFSLLHQLGTGKYDQRMTA